MHEYLSAPETVCISPAEIQSLAFPAHALGGAAIPQRVKHLRNKIREVITEEEHGLSSEEQWFLHHDLDRLFAAVQLYSYPGQYLKESPSVTRIAETLLKLEEDVLGESRYEGRRVGHLTFGTPIDVSAFMAEEGLNPKSAVGPLTRRIAVEIQGLLGTED